MGQVYISWADAGETPHSPHLTFDMRLPLVTGCLAALTLPYAASALFFGGATLALGSANLAILKVDPHRRFGLRFGHPHFSNPEIRIRKELQEKCSAAVVTPLERASKRAPT